MQEDVVFRGTREGLTVVLSRTREYAEIKSRLQEKLDKGERFFTGGEVTVDLGGRTVTRKQLSELQEIINRRHGMKVLSFRHGVVAPDASTSSGGSFLTDQRILEDRSAILIRRTLRSGQHVRHDGSVVVMGDVNPGAEIVASGDIVVFGNLRGVAHAGATGDPDAVVAAFRLLPTQLRIGSLISRAPDEVETIRTRGPEVARIRDGIVTIDQLIS